MKSKSQSRRASKSERKNRTAHEQLRPDQPAATPQPSYAATFQCIGPHCEDPCCGDWDIPVDKITYQSYRQFPAEKLGSLVENFVSQCPGNPPDNLFAYIRRGHDGSCPFFGADRLCAIQKEYGARLLTPTCSIYPRSLALVDGALEGSLSLSCPEAARLVLLQEGSTQKTANLLSGDFRTDNVFAVRQHPGLQGLLLPVRTLIVDFIRDRSRPVWQRLLIIASLCSRLDSLPEDDLISATELLAQYRDALGQGSSSELDRLEAHLPTRLEMTITLSNQRCQDRGCSPRFRDVFWDFIEGIGSTGSEGPDEDVRRFNHASLTFLEPLLDRSPFIEENYLLNYVYQRLFPFGRAGSDRFIAHTMFEEAVLLIIQFSWVTTLLTGVAGRYKDQFTHSHLITTFQSFTRAVEHMPQVLEDALVFVKSRNWDTLPGMATLLRT